MLEMLTQHGGIVHLINMVAGEDEHVFGVIALYEADVLINGICRAGKPRALFARALVRRKNVHAAVGHVKVPRLAAAYVAVELERAVLRQHAHGVYPGVCTVGQRKVNDPVLPAEGNAWFCDVLGQRVKPGALTACQKHRYTAFLQSLIFFRTIFSARSQSPALIYY